MSNTITDFVREFWQTVTAVNVRLLHVWVLLLSITGHGCGPTSRRDLSHIPQRQISYDDMCLLQEFFDQRNAAHATDYRAVDEQATETQQTEPDERGRLRRVVLGEGTYIVSDRRSKRRLRRLLTEEYNRMPDLRFERDVDVRVHVHWWQSGEMRRLRPDREIEVTAGQLQLTLPFNPCVGELLFGLRIYGMRRWNQLADAARARGEVPPPNPFIEDAGAPDEAGTPSTVGDAGSLTTQLVDAVARDTWINPGNLSDGSVRMVPSSAMDSSVMMTVDVPASDITRLTEVSARVDR